MGGMNSTRLTAICAILVALASIEVEAYPRTVNSAVRLLLPGTRASCMMPAHRRLTKTAGEYKPKKGSVKKLVAKYNSGGKNKKDKTSQPTSSGSSRRISDAKSDSIASRYSRTFR